jgi:8-oxo-dGTP diphosphatase
MVASAPLIERERTAAPAGQHSRLSEEGAGPMHRSSSDMRRVPMFGVADRRQRYGEREAAYAVILDSDRRVAVVRGKSGLFLPGGGVEAGESPQEALLRESLEECGRPLEIMRAIGRAIQYCHGESGPFRAHHRFFEARFQGPTARPAADPLEWVYIDEASLWFRYESHVWAVRTVLAESGP